MSKRGLVSGILDIGSAASKAAKNIRASKSNVTEFATPLKTIKKKDKETGKIKEQLAVPITPKDKSVTRLNEQTEELLNPRLTRALDSEMFPEAGSVLPAPGRFFDPNKKDFKPFLKNLENDIDVDLEFGNYLLMGKGKPQDATNKTFQNLYISPRTSYKRSSNKNSVTARSNIYEGASLSVSDMKKNYKDNTGTDGKEIRTNLLQPEKFKILDESGEGRFLDHPIVTVQPMSGKRPHFYTLDMQFTGPVTMDRSLTKIKRTNKKTGEIKEEVPQPNLRPYTVGDVKLGDKIGEITVGKKKHPLYNYIEVDGTSSAPKEMKSIEKFNKGGTAMSMSKQMEMFDLGGLNDQGNTVDPVTNNPVPVGSTQQEVRDDIPAQLSEGEFVLPADVVRYHGLEKIMGIRDQAKQGLQKMESMGQMGNSDEATIPDGVPFNPNSNPLADEKTRMAVGGTPVAPPEIEMPKIEGLDIQKPVTQTLRPSVYANNTTNDTVVPQTNTAATTGVTQVAVPTAPNYRVPTATNTASTYGKLIGSEFGQLQDSETRKYVNPDTKEELYIPFVNGQPVYPIPTGYVFEKDLPEEEKKEDPTKAVKSTSVRQEESDDSGSGFQASNTQDYKVAMQLAQYNENEKSDKDKSLLGKLADFGEKTIKTGIVGQFIDAMTPEYQRKAGFNFPAEVTEASALTENKKDPSYLDLLARQSGYTSLDAMTEQYGVQPTFKFGTEPGDVSLVTGKPYNFAGQSKTRDGTIAFTGWDAWTDNLSDSNDTGWSGGFTTEQEIQDAIKAHDSRVARGVQGYSGKWDRQYVDAYNAKIAEKNGGYIDTNGNFVKGSKDDNKVKTVTPSPFVEPFDEVVSKDKSTKISDVKNFGMGSAEGVDTASVPSAPQTEQAKALSASSTFDTTDQSSNNDDQGPGESVGDTSYSGEGVGGWTAQGGFINKRTMTMSKTPPNKKKRGGLASRK
tara:strand:+ start:701 stop:3574 length:2874 start_codon:yes stop_codon:yes gene_type:complete